MKLFIGVFVVNMLYALDCPDIPRTSTRIYFGNGINTSSHEAQDALDDANGMGLKPLVLSALPDQVNPLKLSFCVAYDRTYYQKSPDDPLSQVPDVILQFLDSAEQKGLEMSPLLLSQVAGVFPLPDWEQNALLDAYSNANFFARPDLKEHVKEYSAQLASGGNVIVVAHSQGNFYVNESYDEISPDPLRFSAIAVATPSNHVAGFAPGKGPWTTLKHDIITVVSWFTLRNVLPPNLENEPACIPTPLGEIACHDFVKSYLSGNKSGPRIVGEVISAIPVPVKDLTATLIFDGSAYPEGTGAAFSAPVIDSGGNLIVNAAYVGNYGGYGVRVWSISPSGIKNWVTSATDRPDGIGFSGVGLSFNPHDNVPILGLNDAVYSMGFSSLWSFASNGTLVNGWPVNSITGGSGNWIFSGLPIVDPTDGAVYVKGGVSYSFSGFATIVTALHPDGSLKWQQTYPNSAGNQGPGLVLGPARNIFADIGGQTFTAFDHGTGDPYCHAATPGFLGLVGGAQGVFTAFGSDLTEFDVNCVSNKIFTTSRGALELKYFDRATATVFGIDYSSSSFDPLQIKLVAVSSTGTFLWRNQVIAVTSAGNGPAVVKNGRVYIFGQDTSDGNKVKLFVLDESTGRLLSSLNTSNLCTNCGVAVAPDGTSYLGDFNSTKIYKLN